MTIFNNYIHTLEKNSEYRVFNNVALIIKKSKDSTECIIFLLNNVFETRNFLFGEKILINKVFMMF